MKIYSIKKGNIVTNKAMINKLKDMADCADSSYAMLEYVFENIDSIFSSKKWEDSDNIIFGDKKQQEGKNLNTAYARCIEARFMKDVILEKGTFKDSTIDNDPKNIPIDATLSLRTINFVNRFKLLHHISQENSFSDSGFSATLFYDTQAKDYIFAIRGTEFNKARIHKCYLQ